MFNDFVGWLKKNTIMFYKITFLLFFINCFCYSQKQDVVRVNLVTEEFTDNLPFDVNFTIQGNIEKERTIQKLKVKCTAIDNESGYFKAINGDTFSCIFDPTKKEEFTCKNIRPLRPNTSYRFVFSGEEMKALSVSTIERIKKIIFTALEKPENLDNPNLIKINEEINSAIQENLNIGDNKVVGLLTIFGDELGNFSNEYMILSNEINITKDKINGVVIGLKKEGIINVLIKIRQANSEFMVSFPITQDNFASITNEISTAEVTNLRKFVEEAKKLKNGNNLLLDTTEINNLDAINSLLDNYLIEQTKKNENEKKVEELKKGTILDKGIAVLSIISTISNEATIDATSENSPYLTYETGIGGRLGTNFDNLIRYGAVNISFSPINSKAKLNRFTLSTRLLKSISLQVGLSKFLLSDNYPRIQNYKLFADMDRNLMLGIGVRLHRLFRVNLSGVLYNYKDLNPLVDKTKLGFVFYPNVSTIIPIKGITGRITSIIN